MADKERYHHGDLRAALVQCALELIEEHGVEALSLREVARRAGVSRGAPYHHFKNKEAMVAAVAHHGFLRLSTGMRDIPEGLDALDGMRAEGGAYFRFALRNPTLYKLMFSDKKGDMDAHPALKAEADCTIGILKSRLGRLQSEGLLPPGELTPWTMAVWASVHGMASMLIDKMGPIDAELHQQAAIEVLLDMIGAGIQAAVQDHQSRV